MTEFSRLEKILKVKFKDKDLLTQALVHRSYINEHPNFKLDHNERLEFLGDAVLELSITEHLYRHYSNPEGELTNWRASLVNADALAEVAQVLQLEKFIYLSSVHVYGADFKNLPVNENQKPCPVTLYAQSKLEAENLIINSGTPYTILRSSMVYGPSEKSGFITNLINLLYIK